MKQKKSWTPHYKKGFRAIAGVELYFHSRWEANFARYLQHLQEKKKIKLWLREPAKFKFGNEKFEDKINAYVPDFKILDSKDDEIYYELKGWVNNKWKTQLERMKAFHPKIKLEVIGKEFFNSSNEKKLKLTIKDWEL